MAITSIPTMTTEQDDLLKQLLGRLSTMVSDGLGAGPAGVLGAGEQGLTDALAGLSPEYMADYFQQNVAPPQTRQFEEDVIPQLREEMISTGDFWGTGRVDVIEDARQKQAERMQAQMADWMKWGREQGTAALPYVPGIAGAGQNLELERIGAAQPYVGMPTTLSYGEPSTNKGMVDALMSAAGGGGRGGSYTGGSTSPSSYGMPSNVDSIYAQNVARGPSGGGGGPGAVNDWLSRLQGGESVTTPSGGFAGGFEPMTQVADGGELPGIGEGTMFDRPDDVGQDYRAYSGFLHEKYDDPTTWGKTTQDEYSKLLAGKRAIL